MLGGAIGGVVGVVTGVTGVFTGNNGNNNGQQAAAPNDKDKAGEKDKQGNAASRILVVLRRAVCAKKSSTWSTAWTGISNLCVPLCPLW